MKTKNKIYEKTTKPVIEKLAKRPYRIGLDLGVGSIGYAVGALTKNSDGEDCIDEIILSGSRIFAASSGAAERRGYRGQRNAIRHKHNRLDYLWKILAEKGLMLPYCKTTDETDTAIVRFSKHVRTLKDSNPYKLRYKGLSEKLELDEIGYCIYHIANHRGSSSVRTFLDASEEEQKDSLAAAENAKRLQDAQKKYKFSTFIELLVAMNTENFSGYRNKQGRDYVPIPTRDIILKELHKLLDTQRSYYPNLMTEEYCERIVKAVDYENEKLVPESGKCPYFPNEGKLPKCHFLNEERRLWEALNNARVMMPYEEKRTVVYKSERLPKEDKELLFKELRSGKSITPASIRKLLPAYLKCKIILQGKDKENTKIEGFRFGKLEKQEFWNRLSESEQDSFLATWVNCPDDRKLKEILVNKFRLSIDESENALKTIALISDYAPVGKSAMKILMKYIVQDGFTWTEAVEQAEKNGELKASVTKKEYSMLPYYGEILTGRTAVIMGKAWHSAFETRRDSAGFKKPSTAPEEEKYGRIANPVVHQALNELRKIVNEMISLFGYAPAEIAVEVGRELKVGIEQREKIRKEQTKQENERKRIFEQFCKPHNLSPKYIRHFQMMESQLKQCPYCLKAITPDDIVNHRVDIDHILPEEDTADSSFNNLVLAHNTCNEEKGKRTPYAAFSGKPIWKEIMQYMETTASMHFKRWRFLLTEEEYANHLKEKGFLSRYASDNAYIAKAAREYLACLYPQKMNEKGFPVQTFKGGETAILRKAWGLQQIGYELGALHKSDDTEEGLANGKNRTDHRHHAVDAITLVYATRSYSKLINTLKARGISESFAQRRIPVPMQLRDLAAEALNDGNLTHYHGFFYEEILDKVKNHANISLKYDTDKNGELLKATTYRILCESKGNLVFLTKKRINSIQVKKGMSDVEKILLDKSFTEETIKIYDSEKQALILKYLKHNADSLERIRKNLSVAEEQLQIQNDSLKSEGKRTLVINESSITKKALELAGGIYYQLSNHLRQKVFIQKEAQDGKKGVAIDTGRSLCIDLFYTKDGKLSGEIVRKVNANDASYVPEYKKQGLEFVERLYQGDTLEVDMTEKNAFKVPTPISPSGRTIVRIDTFTEIGSGICIFTTSVLKSHGRQDSSFYLTSMQKQNPRKIVLSPLGFPLYVSKVLKDRT
ncbi:MAG: type II CRISPR RNA-guided endonuclease Cas9 [Treponema sp.]|nr:type II CRISPR RNA-guided endonuclease Cas9 [Treponema sp.]